MMGDSSRPSYSAPTVGLCADGLSSRDILKGDSRDEVLRIIRDYVVELSCRGSKGQGEMIVESVVDFFLDFTFRNSIVPTLLPPGTQVLSPQKVKEESSWRVP